MTPKILHLNREDREPDLYATDIPFARHGVFRSIVEDRADVETYRSMTHVALATVAKLTVQLDRASLVIAELRDALRVRRAA